MKKFLRRFLLSLSFVSLMGLDSYRHLFTDWPELSFQSKPDNISELPYSRRKRWEQYQEWRKLYNEFKDWLPVIKKGCGASVVAAAETIFEELGAHIENFKSHCLFENRRRISCHTEVEKITDVRKSFLELSENLSNCAQNAPLRILDSSEEKDFSYKGFIEVPVGYDTNPRGLSTPETHSTVGGKVGAELNKMWRESEIQTRNRVMGSALSSEKFLFDYKAENLWAWTPQDFFAELSLKAEGSGAYRSSVPGTRQDEHKLEGRSYLSFALGKEMELGAFYTFRDFLTTEGLYSGYEHVGGLEFVLNKFHGFRRGFHIEGSFFRAAATSLWPDGQGLRLTLFVEGPLEWGGSGRFEGGIEERRDASSFNKLFPYIVFEFKTAPIEAFSWGSEGVKEALNPHSFEVQLKTYYRPERDWWSSTTAVLGAEPSLIWKWQRLVFPLFLLFRYEDHETSPGGSRHNFLSGVGIKPHFEFAKRFHAVFEASFKQNKVFFSAPITNLWTSAESYTRWELAGGLRFEF